MDKHAELKTPVRGTVFEGVKTLRDWADRLARGDVHWRVGHSARALALSWTEARGVPPEVSSALADFAGLTLVRALVEHPVSVGGVGGRSKTDIMAIARSGSGTVVMAVEGKGDSDNFGLPCGKWLRAGKFPRSHENRCRRLTCCANLLPQLVSARALDEVPIQLVHRTASAVLTARRESASDAVLVVHAFLQQREDDDAHYAGFERFVQAFGVQPERNLRVALGSAGGVLVHAAWVDGDPKYLQ